MENYHSVKALPVTFTMTNSLTSTNPLTSTTQDGTCQKSFNYFEMSDNKDKDKSVYWGSSKPMKEVCPTNYKSHSGIPTHSLWNNSTKRKTIVDI